jgi:hypothetical protein
VWYKTASVGIFDFEIALMTPDTMQARRRHKTGKEVSENRKRLGTWRVGGKRDVRE